jgi:hypothetical protein
MRIKQLNLDVRPDEVLTKNQQSSNAYYEWSATKSAARLEGKQIVAKELQRLNYKAEYYDCPNLHTAKKPCADRHLMKQATVHITQYHHGKAKDWDGLAVSVSAFIDGAIEEESLLHSDSPTYITEYTLETIKVQSKEEVHTTVLFTAVP